MTGAEQLGALFTPTGLHYDEPIGYEACALLAKALSLPDSDRADLAAELIASLDPPATESQKDIDRLWEIEIERRAERVHTGGPSGEPWDDVRTRIERDLSAG